MTMSMSLGDNGKEQIVFHWSHLKNKLSGIAGGTAGLHPRCDILKLLSHSKDSTAALEAPHTFAGVPSTMGFFPWICTFAKWHSKINIRRI